MNSSFHPRSEHKTINTSLKAVDSNFRQINADPFEGKIDSINLKLKPCQEGNLNSFLPVPLGTSIRNSNDSYENT